MSPDRIIANTFVAACQVHAELSSTNDLALKLGREFDTPLPLVVVAERQSRGRGRGTHRWWTGERSLAFSLLIDGATCGAAPGRPPLVSLAAALAVVDVVSPLVPVTVGLHWPNDVFAAGRKLAGILVEVLPSGRHVIGIGLNVNDRAADAPPELRDVVATLHDLTGHEHDPESLLIGLLAAINDRLRQARKEPKAVSRCADSVCLHRGKNLVVGSDSDETTGVCQGIDADGALLLHTTAGPQRFLSGTVRERFKGT